MFVWCEANQGFLSTVALGVAVWLVLYEQRRAKEAENFRLTTFVTQAVELIDYMVTKTQAAINEIPIKGNCAATDWDEARFAIDFALKALIPTSPHAKGAVLIADVTRIISDRAPHPFSKADKIAALRDIETRLSKKRTELVAIRT